MAKTPALSSTSSARMLRTLTATLRNVVTTPWEQSSSQRIRFAFLTWIVSCRFATSMDLISKSFSLIRKVSTRSIWSTQLHSERSLFVETTLFSCMISPPRKFFKNSLWLRVQMWSKSSGLRILVILLLSLKHLSWCLQRTLSSWTNKRRALESKAAASTKTTPSSILPRRTSNTCLPANAKLQVLSKVLNSQYTCHFSWRTKFLRWRELERWTSLRWRTQTTYSRWHSNRRTYWRLRRSLAREHSVGTQSWAISKSKGMLRLPSSLSKI